MSREKFIVALLQLVCIGAFLLAWQEIVALHVVSSLFIASPSQILSNGAASVSMFLENIKPTISEIVFSFVLAVVLGIFVGVVIGFQRTLAEVTDPFISAVNSFPKITILPVIVVIMGLGVGSIVVYAFIAAFFPVLMGMVGAVSTIDNSYIKLARSYGIAPSQLYSKVVLPALFPAILANIRIAFVQVIIAVLLGEMFLPRGGLGGLILQLTYKFDAVNLYGVTAIISLLTIVINLSLLYWERAVVKRRK
ncbi:MAG: ABC transporter permease subunit [Nitrososphaerota archaeon]|nr:ABC transporter permease subunit [Nitrososphaerota archaeon]